MSKPASISMGRSSRWRAYRARRPNTTLKRERLRPLDRSWLDIIGSIGRKFEIRQPPDDDGHLHALFVLDLAIIDPVQGDGLPGVARHRDADQIAVADNAVGGSNSTQPEPGRKIWHQAWVEPPPRWLSPESRLGT